ncbi:hypothetical protein A2U01_0060721, partial [Trifolium medium]|nr:hypothetical protein [Trifolium medium]
MQGTSFGPLVFDPKIERTTRANRKAVRLAKEAASLVRLEEETSEEENLIEMVDQEQNPLPPPPPRRTLGDYGMRNN